MGWLAKTVGWIAAHRDAITTGWKLFQALRGRRKETEVTGESVETYYWRKSEEVVRDVVSGLDQSDR